MKLVRISIACIAGFTMIFSSCKTQTIKADIKTEIDSVSYALGINMSESLKRLEVSDFNILAIAKGIQDGLDNKEGAMTNEDAINILNSYFTELQQKKAIINLEEGKRFLEENAKQEGVIVHESGLQYKVLVEGTGPKPVETDMVKVHYRGTLIDGTEFDSSYGRGEPSQFQLNRVVRGWTIGIQLMNVGSKYILYIPSDLGYGERVRQGSPIKPNSLLIFEVELLDIVKE
jgi:FKBP-type peptidyl-prolyl cis-trans isomerase